MSVDPAATAWSLTVYTVSFVAALWAALAVWYVSSRDW